MSGEPAHDVVAVVVVGAGQRGMDRHTDGAQTGRLRVLDELDPVAVAVHRRLELDDHATAPSGRARRRAVGWRR